METMQRLPLALISRLCSILVLAGAACWGGWLLSDYTQAVSLDGKTDSEAGAILERGLPAHATALRYDAIARKALTLSEPDHALARQATERALELNPALVSSWNRLAYLEYIEHGANATVLAALRRSYDVAPFSDRLTTRWRMVFAGSIWDELPADLRTHTLAQADSVVDVQYMHENILALLPTELRAYAEDALAGKHPRPRDTVKRCDAQKATLLDKGAIGPLLDDAGTTQR